jgi:hypothetical protein
MFVLSMYAEFTCGSEHLIAHITLGSQPGWEFLVLCNYVWDIFVCEVTIDSTEIHLFGQWLYTRSPATRHLEEW